jgi:hypothetical protein
MKPKFRHWYVDDICIRTQCIKQSYEILHVSNKMNYLTEQLMEGIYMPITGIIELVWKGSVTWICKDWEEIGQSYVMKVRAPGIYEIHLIKGLAFEA